MTVYVYPTDPDDQRVLRVVRIEDTDVVLWTWDTGRRFGTGQCRVGRRFIVAGEIIFEDEECGVAPSDPVDSDDALVGILSWCCLKPGDTDADFFEEYTPEQLAWAESDACEELGLFVYEWENREDLVREHEDEPDAVRYLRELPFRIRDVYDCHGCGLAVDEPFRGCERPWNHEVTA